jgi:hypothetical protein
VYSPLKFADIALLLFAVFFSRSNSVKFSKRIFHLARDFVHAVIQIGSLDFQKGTQ